jgi:hypothetical protein
LVRIIDKWQNAFVALDKRVGNLAKQCPRKPRDRAALRVRCKHILSVGVPCLTT